MDRHLDGIYFRIKRNEKQESVSFSDLSEDEMRKVIEGHDSEWLKDLCIKLGLTIKGIGNQLDIICEDKIF